MLISVPSFIRIERGSDGSPCPQTKQGTCFAREPVDINISRSAAPKITVVTASRNDCDVRYSYDNICAKFY